MPTPKAVSTSPRTFSKLLDEILQYTPPQAIANDAYNGNPLESGELNGTIDSSMREIGQVYLQVPEKNYWITLSLEHFPALNDMPDGARVKATVNEQGFVSEIIAV